MPLLCVVCTDGEDAGGVGGAPGVPLQSPRAQRAYQAVVAAFNSMERLRCAATSLAEAMKRDPGAGHAGLVEDVVGAAWDGNTMVEAVREVSLETWPGIAVPGAAVPYHDVLEGEVTVSGAVTTLCQRTADAITFWLTAVRHWSVGKPLPSHLRKQDFGWVEYVLAALRDCEDTMQRQRARVAATATANATGALQTNIPCACV